MPGLQINISANAAPAVQALNAIAAAASNTATSAAQIAPAVNTASQALAQTAASTAAAAGGMQQVAANAAAAVAPLTAVGTAAQASAQAQAAAFAAINNTANAFTQRTAAMVQSAQAQANGARAIANGYTIIGVAAQQAVTPLTAAGLALQRTQQAAAATATASIPLGNNLAGSARGANQAAFALQNLGRVAQDAPFGFLGISNNINPLLESFQRLKAETGSTSLALKALGSGLLGPAGLGLAVSVATSLFLVFGDKLFASKEKIDETAEAAKKAKDAIQGIFEGVAKEVTEVQSLVIVLESETATRQRKNDALKELQQLQPEIFSGLKLEGDTVLGLDAAYKKYIASLNTVIAAKIKQQQLETITAKLLAAEGVTLTGFAKTTDAFVKSLAEQQKIQSNTSPYKTIGTAMQAQIDKQTTINALTAQQQDLLKELSQLQSGIDVKTTDPEKIKKTKEAIDQVAEVLRKLIIDRDELAKNPLIKIDDKAPREIELILSAINRLRDLKLSPDNAIIIKLRAEIDALAADIDAKKLRDRIEKMAGESVAHIKIKVPVSFTLRKESGEASTETALLKEIDDFTKKFTYKPIVIQALKFSFDKEGFAKYKKRIEGAFDGLNESVSKIISNLAASFAIGIGDSLGKVLAGGKFENIFSSLFNTLGEGFKTLGEALIKYGAELAIIKAAFKTLNPILAIGAGIALTALGSFIQASLPKFATGGIAYGPTVGIFGEYAGAKNNPEVVAPLSKLKSLLGTTDGNMSKVEVVGTISGNNINIANSRTQKTFNRLYGKRG